MSEKSPKSRSSGPGKGKTNSRADAEESPVRKARIENISKSESDERVLSSSRRRSRKDDREIRKKRKKKHSRSERKQFYPSSDDSSDDDSGSQSKSKQKNDKSRKKREKRRNERKKSKKHKSKTKIKDKEQAEDVYSHGKKTSGILLSDWRSSTGNVSQDTCMLVQTEDPAPPKRRAMVPMTKEEYEKQQSQIKRVYDPETGRHRLTRGDGEILEEIVSIERHKAINKAATHGDGAFFQASLGLSHR